MDEGNVVMEKVAAGMMSTYTHFEGVYIDCIHTDGEVNSHLLYDLYDYYNEKFENNDW